MQPTLKDAFPIRPRSTGMSDSDVVQSLAQIKAQVQILMNRTDALVRALVDDAIFAGVDSEGHAIPFDRLDVAHGHGG